MKKILAIAALAAAGFVATQAYATMPWQTAVVSDKTYAQEDCKDGETWNEETAKCEVKSE